jgi:hypothetical protein
MKTLPKMMATMLLVSIGVLASGTAMAQHRGHGHGYGGARLGLYLGAPLLAAAYYSPRYYPSYYNPYYPSPYYYPPAAVVSVPPPVYVEQRMAQAAPQAQGDWFYCAASRSYYPQVSECPSGWQRVPPQLPPR